MTPPAGRIIAGAIAALLMALTLACRPPSPVSESLVLLTRPAPAADAPAVTQTLANTPTPSLTPASALTPTPALTAAPTPYDSGRNMYRIWPGVGQPGGDTLAALADAAAQRDISQVPVILEALRFLNLDGARAAVRTLESLTDGDFAFDLTEWTEMGEWLGRNSADYPPPDGYAEWKISILETIDPEMAALLRPVLDNGAPVNLTEIMWGGVRVDGIPPLESPPHTTPELADDWLLPDDRVFGVAINGEHRAYPLRIMNAHELANDTLGGEPIALVY